jgi:hypothetical protein
MVPCATITTTQGDSYQERLRDYGPMKPGNPGKTPEGANSARGNPGDKRDEEAAAASTGLSLWGEAFVVGDKRGGCGYVRSEAPS